MFSLSQYNSTIISKVCTLHSLNKLCLYVLYLYMCILMDSHCYLFVPPGTNNPFSTSASNPFEQSTQRVPLSQIQTSANVGFTQTSSSGLLPAPLIPVNNLQPMQPQQQASYNPFLWTSFLYLVLYISASYMAVCVPKLPLSGSNVPQ